MLAAANMIATNASTNVSYNIEPVIDIVSTRLFEQAVDDNLMIDLSSYFRGNQFISTQIEDLNDSESNSSTWLDWFENNFDIISNLVPKKSYKLKSKIISVSKFTPKIVIE